MDKAESDKQGCRRSLKSCAILATAQVTDLTETYRANRIHQDDKNRVVEGRRAVTDWGGDGLGGTGLAGFATCESKPAAPYAAGQA
jgi:hypothetical protein